MIQITEDQHRQLLAKAERLTAIEREYDRLQFEVIGAFTRHGIAMLDRNPCGPGEVRGAIDRLASERLLMAKMAADRPQFHSPVVAWAAKELRDKLLREENRS